jgi:hypothetical protein
MNMHTDTGQSHESCGPSVYENWLAAQAGQPARGIEEYELYTDAHITGEITDGYGPYQFLNLVPFPMQNNHARATIVLRLGMHIEDALDRRDMTRTDAGQYHGGNLVDEIAALASLAMGIRLKAGGLTRTFDPGGDPLGRPRKFGNPGNPQPVLLTGSYGLRLPCATGTHPLTALVPMTTVPSLLAERCGCACTFLAALPGNSAVSDRVTSPATMARRSGWPICAAARTSLSSLRPLSTTFVPSRTKASATAKPMPLPAPVTMAVFVIAFMM